MFVRSMHQADRAALLAVLALLLWSLPFFLLCWFVGSGQIDEMEDPPAYWRAWSTAALAAGALVGAWLGLHLWRVWIWRRRRNPRPSREIQAERQRIARTLHDTVGSQLVNACMLLDGRQPQQSQVQAVLENCLMDLRLLVDSMDCDQSALTDRLAILRHRLQPVLERRGIALRWQVPECDAAGLQAGEATQQIASIAQEALSNALQHAHAQQIALTLEEQQGEWHLCIEDDGRGMERSPLSAGQGLRGMAQRARLAGASLQAGPGVQGRGVGIHVRWPVPPPQRG